MKKRIFNTLFTKETRLTLKLRLYFNVCGEEERVRGREEYIFRAGVRLKPGGQGCFGGRLWERRLRKSP